MQVKSKMQSPMLPNLMSCLITLETRPCEDPTNFKVLRHQTNNHRDCLQHPGTTI